MIVAWVQNCIFAHPRIAFAYTQYHNAHAPWGSGDPHRHPLLVYRSQTQIATLRNSSGRKLLSTLIPEAAIGGTLPAKMRRGGR